MADFAIGQAFIKAHRSILRIVPLKMPCRYFARRDAMGWVELPELDDGYGYIPLNGVQQATFQVDNNDREFRLFGDNGWSDSVTTGGRVRMSAQTFFMKAVEQSAEGNCPVFRGDYDAGYSQIERARYDQDYEVYVELLKEMGRTNGDEGDFIYDFAGFNCAIRNYNEPNPADDMVQVSFDAMSRGRPVFGKLNAGSMPIEYGETFGVLLSIAFGSGPRQYVVTPVDNANSVAVSSTVTVAYSDGTDPLEFLALTDASGFRLETGTGGIIIPSDAVLNTVTGVVTITPAADLPAGTILRVVVRDGAITQAVDGDGAALQTGFRRPLQGFSSSFRTA
jgi:hypothetical protein